MSTDNLLSGGIDLHTHSRPSIYDRDLDDFELAAEAREAGMRGVVIKAHESPTASRAALVNSSMEGISGFGGIVLNHYVGGFNVNAVDAALKMGARIVWMPTIYAQNHLVYFEGKRSPVPGAHRQDVPASGLTVLDDDGRVRPEVQTVLKRVAEADAILGTGHLSAREILAVTDAALAAGVRKVLVNHADMELNGLTLDDQVALAKKGAILEKCYLTLLWSQREITGRSMAESIKTIGADYCVLVTDLGQTGNPRPAAGMHAFVQLLMKEGITRREIQVMLAENPARLLGL